MSSTLIFSQKINNSDIPDKPKKSEYSKWEKMIGIPKICEYIFFSFSNDKSRFEYFCVFDKNDKIIPIGVRDIQNDSVFWKKEYLVKNLKK